MLLSWGSRKIRSARTPIFRGLKIYNNVVYYSKGSGGNGINTVYFIDTTGNACPSTSTTPGVGLPQTSASLPTVGGNGDQGADPNRLIAITDKLSAT
jgi:hypothetical protein